MVNFKPSLNEDNHEIGQSDKNNVVSCEDGDIEDSLGPMGKEYIKLPRKEKYDEKKTQLDDKTNEPPLRKSLFRNVPPFLNYLPNGLDGE